MYLAPVTASRRAIAEELFIRVSQLGRLAAREAAGLDLTVAQARALGTLYERGPMRVTALAAAEGIAQPTMTQIVGRLVQRGFVARSADAGDGRAVVLTLTEAGLQILIAARDRISSAYVARLQSLDEEGTERLGSIIPLLDLIISPPTD